VKTSKDLIPCQSTSGATARICAESTVKKAPAGGRTYRAVRHGKGAKRHRRCSCEVSATPRPCLRSAERLVRKSSTGRVGSGAVLHFTTMSGGSMTDTGPSCPKGGRALLSRHSVDLLQRRQSARCSLSHAKKPDVGTPPPWAAPRSPRFPTRSLISWESRSPVHARLHALRHSLRRVAERTFEYSLFTQHPP
jgi:hypothetical protein